MVLQVRDKPFGQSADPLRVSGSPAGLPSAPQELKVSSPAPKPQATESTAPTPNQQVVSSSRIKLPENRRQELDGIVKQMTKNREADDAVRFVVNDFKAKYASEGEIIEPTGGEGAKGLKGFGLGAAKGAGQTIAGTSALGQKGINSILGALLPKGAEKALGVGEFGDKGLGSRILESGKLEAKGGAEKTGKFIEQLAEFFVPAGVATKATKAISAIPKVAKAGKLAQLGVKSGIQAGTFGGVTAAQGGSKGEVKTSAVIGAALPVLGKVVAPLAKKLPRTISNFFFGPEGTQGIANRFRDPKLTGEFLKSARRQGRGKTTEDIVSLMGRSIKKVSDKAVGLFKQAESKIVNKAIPRGSAINAPLKTTREFLKISNLKPATIQNSGLGDTEVRIVNRIVREINTLKKPTTKSVLNLRRTIDNLFRGTKSTVKSDALITRLRGQLNRAIEGVDPEFRKASQSFAKDKQFLEKIGVNLTGRNPKINLETTANKLFQLSQKLDDPFQKEATERLLAQLGNRTGVDFARFLRALKTATKLSPQQSQGLRAGVIRELIRAIEVGVSGVASATGKASSFVGKNIAPRLPSIPKALKGSSKAGPLLIKGSQDFE